MKQILNQQLGEWLMLQTMFFSYTMTNLIMFAKLQAIS